MILTSDNADYADTNDPFIVFRGHFISSMICFKYSGISGNGSNRICIEPSPLSKSSCSLWRTARPCLDNLPGIVRRGFLFFPGRARDRFRNGEQILQIKRSVPAGIEFAIADTLTRRLVPKTLFEIIDLPGPRAFRFRHARCRPLSCMVSCKSFCT